MKSWLRKTLVLVLALVMVLPAVGSAHEQASTTSGAADFEAAAGALAGNTADLSASIALVYGDEAGEAFRSMWEAHIGFFVDYVVATAGDDEAGRAAALAEVDEYRADFSAFLAGANPNLEASALSGGLQMHVNQLVDAFDGYVEGDYETAYEALREAYSHMFMTADALSGAIAMQYPDRFPGESRTAAVELRAVLGQLMGEHAALAVLAMQKGVDGAADFGAAAEALGGNTADLSAAIASVYGDEAGEAFRKMWEAHIGFFVDYVVATAGNDEAGRAAALAELDEYRADFSAFLAGANPNLEASALSGGLQMHVGQLVEAFDSYVDGEYETAYDAIREAYGHMFMTADALSGAIVKQFNDKYVAMDHEGTAMDHMGHDDGMAMGPTKVMLWLGNATVKVDDAEVKVDSAPFLWEGTSYVPLRFLSEGIGAKVGWDASTQTITVMNGADVAEFWVGADYMEYNDMRMEIGADVVLRDGRTQVPIRFIAQLFGWDVAFSAGGEVTLTKK
ncbi:copper amine oxidase N-terminal domain-containing protein [Paenibacillus sp. TRM 82003]|nr:copper amine oxidase N-terminal domain-containing protein [Paenibacillus sp. TRM 82003]